jgi:hypothetical protein
MESNEGIYSEPINPESTLSLTEEETKGDWEEQNPKADDWLEIGTIVAPQGLK